MFTEELSDAIKYMAIGAIPVLVAEEISNGTRLTALDPNFIIVGESVNKWSEGSEPFGINALDFALVKGLLTTFNECAITTKSDDSGTIADAMVFRQGRSRAVCRLAYRHALRKKRLENFNGIKCDADIDMTEDTMLQWDKISNLYNKSTDEFFIKTVDGDLVVEYGSENSSSTNFAALVLQENFPITLNKQIKIDNTSFKLITKTAKQANEISFKLISQGALVIIAKTDNLSITYIIKNLV